MKKFKVISHPVKCLCLVLVAMTLFLTNLQGQRFYGKLIGGVNAAQVDGDDLSGFKKFGFLAGLGVEYKINSLLSLQPELYYTQKGSRNVDDFNYMIWRINFIEFPVLFNYQLYKKFSVQGGPALDFLLSSKRSSGYDFYNIPGFQKLNLVGVAGVEYEFVKGMAVNLRYGYSILPFKNTGPVNILWYYTNTVSFSLRILLNKKAEE